MYRIDRRPKLNLINRWHDRVHCAGVKPKQIKSYCAQQGHHISTLQIQYMIRRTEVATFQSESEDLIHYVNRESGALTRVFEKEVDGERHRFAVLTFRETELNNLKQFGDTLFIDGTMARLKLRWEVIPITAIDQHRELVSCGIMYAAITSEETLTWMLSEIWRIVEPLNILRTIVSDEDCAFIAAFRNLMQIVNQTDEHIIIHHVLCALHKQRNFMKKMQTCGLTKAEKEIAIDLFRKICYHTNNNYASHCLEQLKELNEKLCHYIEKQVEPELHQFSRSHMNGIHANGYNTTSPGESMNNMLKHDLRSGMTLRESRRHFDSVLDNHAQNAEIKRNHRRIPVGPNTILPVELYRCLGHAMATKLEKQAIMAETTVVEPLTEEDDLFTHVAFSPDHPEIEYKLNEDYCSCNTVHFLGIPCCHLLKLHKELSKPFPSDLIDQRWSIDERSGDSIDPEPITSSCSTESETEELESEVRSLVREEEDESDLPNLEPESPRDLYLRIFHLGKNIASKACQNSSIARRITGKLREMLGELIELPPDSLPSEGMEIDPGTPVVDVVDHMAHPRGRPRHIGSGHENRSRKGCKICDGTHETRECVGWKKLQDAMDEFRDYDGPRRRCRVCSAPGHNKRTCPIRLEALEYYTEGKDGTGSSEEGP